LNIFTAVIPSNINFTTFKRSHIPDFRSIH